MLENRYTYKVPASSDTGLKLEKLMAEITAAEEAASELTKSVRATAWLPSTIGVAGGVAAFEFPRKPSGGYWKYLSSEDGRNYYAPDTKTSRGQRLRRKMNALPIINPRAMNAIFGIDSGNTSFGVRKVNDGYIVTSFFEITHPDASSLTLSETTV